MSLVNGNQDNRTNIVDPPIRIRLPETTIKIPLLSLSNTPLHIQAPYHQGAHIQRPLDKNTRKAIQKKHAQFRQITTLVNTQLIF